MYGKFNKLLATLALLLFGLAQVQGWNLFEDQANPGRSSSGGGRTYHK